MSVEMGVGASSHADVSVAGQEAAEQVISHLAGRKPDLVLVFSSIRFADPRLLRAIRSATGGVPLIGCTDAGGISTSGPKRRSVTVIGLDLQGMYVCDLSRAADLPSPTRGRRTISRRAPASIHSGPRLFAGFSGWA